MKIGVFDLESNGFPEDNAKVTEIAMAVWEPEEKRIIESTSFMVNSLDEGEEISEEITQLTGITTEAVRTHGKSLKFLIEGFDRFVDKTDCVMARNGMVFDIPMVSLEYNRRNRVIPQVTCIDDYVDVEYPEWVKGRSLSYIAADFGFLNPFPHSAMGDVLTMIKVFEKAEFDMAEALENARTPLFKVIACVSFDEKDKAKELGFRWDPDEKIWWKNFRERVVNKIDFPFDVKKQEFSPKPVQKSFL